MTTGSSHEALDELAVKDQLHDLVVIGGGKGERRPLQQKIHVQQE